MTHFWLVVVGKNCDETIENELFIKVSNDFDNTEYDECKNVILIVEDNEINASCSNKVLVNGQQLVNDLIAPLIDNETDTSKLIPLTVTTRILRLIVCQ